MIQYDIVVSTCGKKTIGSKSIGGRERKKPERLFGW